MKPLLILENVYLGDRNTAKKLAELKKLGIGSILNVDSVKCHFPQEFNYYKLHYDDNDQMDFISFFERSSKLINESISKTPILVHCNGGMHRSPTAIIAYLIKYKKMTSDQALAIIQSKRRPAQPRQACMSALKIWENSNNKRN